MNPVDRDCAYRPVRRLTVVPVADEAVVYDRRTNRLHRLDPIATVVWSGLDGTTTTRALCTELAEAFGAPVEQVTQDVLRLLDQLAEQDLLVSDDGSEEPSEDPEAEEDDEPPPSPGEIRVLRVTRTSCVDSVTSLGWIATDALLIGGFAVGIRSSDAEVRTKVRDRWAGAEWVDGLPVDANVSIRPAVATKSGTELGQVYADCTLVGRGRDLDALLDRASREVAGRIIRARSDLLGCQVSVLQAPDGPTLAPGSWWPRLIGHERTLADAGWRLLGRHAVLDGSRDSSAVVRLPRLENGTAEIELEKCPTIVRVVGAFTAGTAAPAERLAAVAMVVSPGTRDAGSSAVLQACGALATNVELVRAEHPDAFLRHLRT